jgi:peroxiredoxin
MRTYIISLFVFILFVTTSAQDLMLLTTEKISGDKIIPNRFVTSFEKINAELDSFSFNKEIYPEPSLFKLELMALSNKEIYIYGLGTLKDSMCIFTLDANNDKNFGNDEITIIPVNKDNLKPSYIACNYDGGTTWIQLRAAETDKDNNLIDINFKICEYRKANVIQNQQVYSVRIESRTGIDYSNPYFLLEGSLNKIKLHKNEYLSINNSRYLIKSSNVTGDTIVFEKVPDDIPLTSTQIGYKAPDLAGKTIKGANINLKDYKGKFVLLDFWYLGCGACIAEMEYTMKGIYELYGGEKFEIVGVNVKDNSKEVFDFIKKKNYSWSQMLAPLKGDYVSKYHVFVFPSYYLIDPDGFVVENDFYGIATLPYMLNKYLPDDYLVNKLLLKNTKFSYKGCSDSEYSLLLIKPINGKMKSYVMLKHNNEWQYSLDLPNGEYLYYYYFDGKKEIDSTNPNTIEENGQCYSILEVPNE